MSEEIVGEVAMVELPGRKWTMRFDGSTIVTSNGMMIVLSYEGGGTMLFSFKLEFPCLNNATEYDAYLTGLVIALSMGIK